MRNALILSNFKLVSPGVMPALPHPPENPCYPSMRKGSWTRSNISSLMEMSGRFMAHMLQWFCDLAPLSFWELWNFMEYLIPIFSIADKQFSQPGVVTKFAEFTITSSVTRGNSIFFRFLDSGGWQWEASTTVNLSSSMNMTVYIHVNLTLPEKKISSQDSRLFLPSLIQLWASNQNSQELSKRIWLPISKEASERGAADHPYEVTGRGYVPEENRWCHNGSQSSWACFWKVSRIWKTLLHTNYFQSQSNCLIVSVSGTRMNIHNSDMRRCQCQSLELAGSTAKDGKLGMPREGGRQGRGSWLWNVEDNGLFSRDGECKSFWWPYHQTDGSVLQVPTRI